MKGDPQCFIFHKEADICLTWNTITSFSKAVEPRGGGNTIRHHLTCWGQRIVSKG